MKREHAAQREGVLDVPIHWHPPPPPPHVAILIITRRQAQRVISGFVLKTRLSATS